MWIIIEKIRTYLLQSNIQLSTYNGKASVKPSRNISSEAFNVNWTFSELKLHNNVILQLRKYPLRVHVYQFYKLIEYFASALHNHKETEDEGADSRAT